jgi:hypothetical protein
LTGGGGVGGTVREVGLLGRLLGLDGAIVLDGRIVLDGGTAGLVTGETLTGTLAVFLGELGGELGLALGLGTLGLEVEQGTVLNATGVVGAGLEHFAEELFIPASHEVAVVTVA